MASINGVSIKAFKKFRGHEGEELYQGNVYYNGKKLGFWSQDAHGGVCDNFEFDETVLNNESEKYKNYSGKVSEEDKKYYDITFFMIALSDLTIAEKQFKKGLKNGYHSLVKISGGGFETCWSTSMPASTEKEKDAVLKMYRDRFVDGFKKGTPKWAHEDIKVTVYGENDFTVEYPAA